MEWLIWIPFIPPGSNELKRLHFLSVATSRRNVHEMMEPLVLGIQSAAGYMGPAEVVSIEATFHWTDARRRDIGNYAESLKAIIDSLVGVCIIDDDVSHVVMITLKGQLKSQRKGISLRVKSEDGNAVSGQPRSKRS